MSNRETAIPVPADITPRKADGNPEGKGVNGVMADWQRSQPRGVVAKPQPQVLAEFFTSMLVLSATFKYRPVVGGTNYLYWIDGKWSLSLIGPHEWTDARRAGFAGTCTLQPDMTWTIEPSDRLDADSPVTEAIVRFYEAFANMLDTDLTLEELLPFYLDTADYRQRVFANALSRSIRASVILSDDEGNSARDWGKALPASSDRLLASNG